MMRLPNDDYLRVWSVHRADMIFARVMPWVCSALLFILFAVLAAAEQPF